MSTRRITQLDASIEYQQPALRKVTQLLTQVEYQQPALRKVTQLFIMIELSPPGESVGRKYGPAVQMMG
ncbi:MAG: hypothetical protein XU15_C0011G0148 [candidate division NC10 bacterium CSP1-5]|nr:MAG: hypothetical protein XU15_C0011G0004 [candidate division NC10 bacterium CSP1-5]KRT69466.1 MAG: hypothetical protein XU15_C0011G0148 [candidate division NC10 bacterium CSP1-5]